MIFQLPLYISPLWNLIIGSSKVFGFWVLVISSGKDILLTIGLTMFKIWLISWFFNIFPIFVNFSSKPSLDLIKILLFSGSVSVIPVIDKGNSESLSSLLESQALQFGDKLPIF